MPALALCGVTPLPSLLYLFLLSAQVPNPISKMVFMQSALLSCRDGEVPVLAVKVDESF
jgi:hypothetical protein